MHADDVPQAPTAALFTSIAAPSPVLANDDFTFTVAAGVAADSSLVTPPRLVIQLLSSGTVKSVAAPNTAGESAAAPLVLKALHRSAVSCDAFGLP
jgi:hypothetical protein